jgi:hypothetical protein
MLRLLKFLIFGDAHLHEYKIIKEETKEYTFNSGMAIDRRYYILQCKKCGNIKTTEEK